MMRIISKKDSYNKGFTLVELIVALGIFGIVAVVAVGAFLRIIDANKKAQALQSIVNNTSFIMDSLARELRVAKNYYCNSTGLASYPTYSAENGAAKAQGAVFSRNQCTSGDTALSFLSSRTAPINNSHVVCRLTTSYHFENNVLYKAQQRACNESLVVYEPISSTDDLIINSFTFFVSDVPGALKSRAFISLRGTSGQTIRTQSNIDVQMTVSQRVSN